MYPLKNKVARLGNILLISILSLFVLIASGSRSAFIALLIQLTFLFSKKVLHQPYQNTIVLTFSLLFLSLTFPFFMNESEYENRAEIWKTAVIAGLQSPVIGHGFGNIQQTMHATSLVLNNKLIGYIVDSTHNIFLDFWVQSGALGIILFVVILFYTTTAFVLRKNDKAVVILLGIIATMSFNPVSVVTLLQLWWIIGHSYLSQHATRRNLCG